MRGKYYNHFDILILMEHSIAYMTLSHCIDILPYILICIANPYSVRVLCMCLCVCMHVLCMRVHRFGYTVYVHISEFKCSRVCQDIPQKWIAKDTFTIPS